MEEVIKKIKEIKSGQVGIVVYSAESQNIVALYNDDIVVPLASAAKIAIGFAVAKMIEEKQVRWSDEIDNIAFSYKEDSKEIYPHLQGRTVLTLRNAVEVMIACHDNFIAQSVVGFCGGWEEVNKRIQSSFSKINITKDPRDVKNVGNLKQVLKLLIRIFQGYESNPVLWEPIINGMVRQQGNYEGIPGYRLAHMTGGLPTAFINIGILGTFHENPLLYVIGGMDLPNRYENQEVDSKIMEVLRYLYKEFVRREIEYIDI
ncbi:serine hydrolase [Bacillus sp. Xin]|uniref:serine hydrolase n=1 Tax=unclassified Bacillus (in: firmicutes) TaxID=185979 RepID=UPI001573129F|nr:MULTISPECIES: serine hydrolase [unclassified Bacillus (in: firmicutes)]MBC6973280.1 serine hydrolase [Bacillus sp. Xin]NSW35717.1 serine hydrolase [Bacillus sp. Xin1]